ncbi:MAG: porin family protein [Bacteroidales bacterium]|nr:porin family protein [Bacteroidales bacterium]
MKRVLALFILAIFSISMAKSQDPNMFRFGLKIQPSVSWLNPETRGFESDGAKLNFGYGLILEKSFNMTTVLYSGVLLTGFGGPVNFPGGDEAYYFQLSETDTSKVFVNSRTHRLHYVEIPLHLKFRTPEIGYMTYNAHFGLDLGIRTKAQSNYEGRLNSTTGSAITIDEYEMKSNVGFLRLGLNVGIGGEYNLAGSTSIVMGLSYYNGFTNILSRRSDHLYASNNQAENASLSFKSHAVALTLGVLF